MAVKREGLLRRVSCISYKENLDMSRFSLFITFFTALVMLAHGQDAATQATQAQAAPKVVFGSIDVC